MNRDALEPFRRPPQAEDLGPTATYAVDERLVQPDTRFEILDGEVHDVPPSLEPHANRHSKLAAILEAHVVAAYDVAVDMLTRTSEKSDFAPDASVYPRARDPETGGRRLEELAFEVVSEERLAHAGRKAARLRERGVRRVFAIDVGHESVLEWNTAKGTWEILPDGGAIDDGAFVVPLPLRALVDAATVDDAMAAALLAKRNPVLVGAIEAEVEKARAETTAEAILTVLQARGVGVGEGDVRRIRAERDEATLARWLTAAAICRDVRELG